MNRRSLLTLSGIAAVAGLTGLRMPKAQAETFEVTKSKDEWRGLLTPEQFATLREEATERRFSSPLGDEHRKGQFHCAGCDLPVYDSSTKFESGTGWPSFFEPLPDAVKTRLDSSFLLGDRTEVHCRRCGGHLGHVFEDGPKPTGLRYCMNGVAMTFHPADGNS
jgi:peptide-methionine (R)-S-oxide reductase